MLLEWETKDCWKPCICSWCEEFSHCLQQLCFLRFFWTCFHSRWAWKAQPEPRLSAGLCCTGICRLPHNGDIKICPFCFFFWKSCTSFPLVLGRVIHISPTNHDEGHIYKPTLSKRIVWEKKNRRTDGQGKGADWDLKLQIEGKKLKMKTFIVLVLCSLAVYMTSGKFI